MIALFLVVNLLQWRSGCQRKSVRFHHSLDHGAMHFQPGGFVASTLMALALEGVSDGLF